MRIVFIGSTKRGYLTLKALLKYCKVVGVVSLEQHPHEIENYENEIEELSSSHDVPHLRTKRMKDQDYSLLFKRKWKPDIIFIVGCRILIPPSIYEVPPHGTLAVHDSLLPEYRGFAPLNWAIINGEKNTGVTLFYLSERIDEGDILLQKVVTISESESAAELYDKICKTTVSVVIEGYELIKSGKAYPISQKQHRGSYTCSRSPQDGLIDWSKPTKDIYNLIRALEKPYPGAFTYYLEKKLVIWRAKTIKSPDTYTGRIPGKVISINKDRTVDILTGDGIIRLSLVQYENSEPVPASKIIKSVRSRLGIYSQDLIQRIEILERYIEELKKDKNNQMNK
jgi:methionyl-tRNA formyltransferase